MGRPMPERVGFNFDYRGTSCELWLKAPAPCLSSFSNLTKGSM